MLECLMAYQFGNTRKQRAQVKHSILSQPQVLQVWQWNKNFPMLKTLVRVKAPLALVKREWAGYWPLPPSPDDGPLESPLQVWTSVLIMMITMLTHHHSAKCGYRSWTWYWHRSCPGPEMNCHLWTQTRARLRGIRHRQVQPPGSGHLCL